MKRSFYISISICFIAILQVQSQAPAWSWVKAVHTNGPEEPNGMAVDHKAGELVVVGAWEDDLSAFYGDNSRPSTDFSTTYGQRDGFVAKYDTLGNYIWAFTIGGPQNDEVNAVSVDPSGNIYITGYHRSGLTQFSGTASLTPDSSVNNPQNLDFFTAKYNRDGELIWVSSSSSGNLEVARGQGIFATDSAVYTGGYYEGDLTVGSFTYPRSASTQDVFVLKQDPDGNVLWSLACSSSGDDRFREIKSDENGIYFIGIFQGASINFYDIFGGGAGNVANNNSGTDDLFLSSYSTKGNFLWARGIGSPMDDMIEGLAMDKTYLYVTGGIDNNAIFPGFSGNPVPVVDHVDIFLSRHQRSNGSTDWVRVVSGSGNYDDVGLAVTRDQYKQIYISGLYKGTIDFFGDTSLTDIGNQDLFLASFFFDGTFNWAKSAGSDQNDDAGKAIATDLADRIFLTGTYDSEGFFDAITLPDDGHENIFLAALNLSCVDAKSGVISAIKSNICPSDSTRLVLDDHLGTINWQSSPEGLNLWTNIPGGIDTAIYVSPIENTDYRAYITAGDCNPDSSNIATIQVFPEVTATLSGDTSICPATSATLRLDFSGTSPWDFRYSNGSDSTDVSGVTDNPYNLLVMPSGSTGYTLVSVADGNGCTGSVSGSASVTVLPASATNLSGDATICAGDTTQLTVELGGISPWTVEYEDGTDTILIPGIAVNPHLVGVSPTVNTSYSMVSLVDGNGCDGVTAGSATIVVEPLPDADPGKDSILCGLTFQFEATLIAGTGIWTKTSGPGSEIYSPGPGFPNAEVTVDSFGSYEFTWTVTSGSCNNDSTITLVFIEIPMADPGKDSTLCGKAFQFEAIPSVGAGLWTQTSGPGTAVYSPGPGVPNADVTIDVYGTYKFTWTETNGPCSDDSTITLLFTEIPIPDPGKDTTLCGPTFQFEAIPSVGSGAWAQISGPGTAVYSPGPGSPTAEVTIDVYGSYEFTWTETNGPCSQDSAIVINFLEVPKSDPGPGGVTCGNVIGLQAIPSVGTGQWTTTSGPGSIVFTPSSNVPIVTATASSYGSYEITWTETNGICSDDSTITLLFTEIPVPDPGKDTTLCRPTFQFEAIPSVGSGAWAQTSGPGTAVYSPGPGSPSADVTVDVYGSYEFTWTETNGPCSKDSAIVVTFLELPVSNPGSGGETCGNVFGLRAFPSAGAGQWSQTSGPGTVVFTPSANNPVVNATASLFGTYEMTWSETNGICSDDSTVTVVYYEPPVINPGSGGNSCGLSFDLNAVPSVGEGKWSLTAGPGTGTFFPSDTIPNPTLTVTQYGNYSVSWVEINGPCSPGATIFVNFFNEPMADPGPGGEVCGLDFNLDATPSSGGGTWTLMTGPGSAVFTPSDSNPDATVTVSDYGTYEIIWTEVNGGCSDDSVITVTFTSSPVSDAGPDDEVCAGEGSFVVSGTTSSDGVILWTSSGNGSFDNDTIDNPTYTFGTETGSVSLTKTVTSGGSCADSVDVMLLTLTPAPVSDAGPDAEVCSSESFYTLSGTTSAGGSILWTSSGDGSFDNDTIDNPTYTIGSETGSVILTKSVISPGSCADSVDAMVLTLSPVPVSNAGPDAEVCAGEGSFVISGTTSSGGTILWTTSGDGSFNNDALDNPNYTFGTETGSVTLTKTVTSGGSCADSVDVMLLTLTPAPVSNAGPDDEVCSSESFYTLSGTTSTGGSILWTASGDGSFDNDTIDNPTYTIGSETGSVILTKAVIGAGSCTDSVDAMFLTLSPVAVSKAGPDAEVCAGEGSFVISGTTSSGGTILWTSSGNGSFDNDAIDNPTYTIGSETGSVTLTKTVTSAGSCSDATEAMLLTIIAEPESNPGNGGQSCSLDFTFGAVSGSGTGLWSKTSGPGSVVFDPSPGDPEATANVSEIGAYVFTWTVIEGNCSGSGSVTVFFNELFQVEAGAGGDVCGLVFDLNANQQIGASGQWMQSSGPGSVTFSPSDTLYNATATVDQSGRYQFRWIESDGNCIGEDSVEVNYVDPPTADAGPDQLLQFDFNTYLEANAPLFGTGQWTILSGSGQFSNDHDPGALVTGLSLGENEFRWIVQSLVCEEVSDDVLIEVEDLYTPTMISPNGDGSNDVLVFGGIELQEGSELIIYNRWGAEVFRTRNYQNNWEGNDNKGRELISGTYFYVLKLPSSRIIKSFVEIVR